MPDNLHSLGERRGDVDGVQTLESENTDVILQGWTATGITLGSRNIIRLKRLRSTLTDVRSENSNICTIITRNDKILTYRITFTSTFYGQFLFA